VLLAVKTTDASFVGAVVSAAVTVPVAGSRTEKLSNNASKIEKLFFNISYFSPFLSKYSLKHKKYINMITVNRKE
jgi:hypothetical protein